MKELIIKDIKENRHLIMAAVFISFIPQIVTLIFVLCQKTGFSCYNLVDLSFAFFLFGNVMITILFPLFLVNSVFGLDDNNKTSQMLLSLPLKKWRLWVSKFLSVLLTVFICWLLFVVVNIKNFNLLNNLTFSISQNEYVTFGSIFFFSEGLVPLGPLLYFALSLFFLSVYILATIINPKLPNTFLNAITILLVSLSSLIFLIFKLQWNFWYYDLLFLLLWLTIIYLYVSYFIFIKRDYPDNTSQKYRTIAKGCAIGLLLFILIFIPIIYFKNSFQIHDTEYMGFEVFKDKLLISCEKKQNDVQLYVLNTNNSRVKKLYMGQSGISDFSKRDGFLAVYTEWYPKILNIELSKALFYPGVVYIYDFNTDKEYYIKSNLIGLNEFICLKDERLVFLGCDNKTGNFSLNFLSPHGRLEQTKVLNIKYSKFEIFNDNSANSLILEEKGNQKLYKIDINTGEETLLSVYTDLPKDEDRFFDNLISPDGKNIIFIRRKCINNTDIIYQYILKNIETQKESILKEIKLPPASKEYWYRKITEIYWLNNNEVYITTLGSLRYFNIQNSTRNFDYSVSKKELLWDFCLSPDKTHAVYFRANYMENLGIGMIELICMDLKTHEKFIVLKNIPFRLLDLRWINDEEILFLKEKNEINKANIKTKNIETIFKVRSK